MGFTGDSICIKADLSFERIENLKEGDLLYNPETGLNSKIKKIETFYSEEGYIFKTENFFEINMSKDTYIKTSSLNINKKPFCLNSPNYINPYNLNKLCFLVMPKIESKNNSSFEELFLYSKILLKGSYDEATNKLILNNFKENYKEYQKNISHKNINIVNNKQLKKLYINEIKDISWLSNITKNTKQRTINTNVFNISNENINYFVNELLKENCEFYLDDNNFRLYVQSKIISVQLFYLLLGNTNKYPKIEQIKKDNWNIKNVKNSNKKNKYSVSCHDKIKPILSKGNYFFQQVTFFDKNNRNLKYIKIITENNDPFVVYNTIVKEIE